MERVETAIKQIIETEKRARPVPADLVVGSGSGYYRASRSHLLYENKPARSMWRNQVLAFLRDNVNPAIPRWYYQAVLGHDLHLSTYAELYARHYHATERDPFTGMMGWMENIGCVSHGKVTVEFRDFTVDGLVSNAAEMGDFKFHRVGTDATAEDSTHTVLIADSGITTGAGSQLEGSSADIYKSVSTITADATETWQEHAINSQTGAGGGELMDRSLITPTVSVVSSDTVEFTYEITINEEA